MIIIKDVIAFPMFWLTWLTFFVAGFCSLCLQLYWYRGTKGVGPFWTHWFPAGEWKRVTARMDVWLYAGVKVTGRLLGRSSSACSTLGALVVSRQMNEFFPHQPLPHGLFAILAAGFSLFLVSDFMSFLTHYLQHFNQTLWELHKVHHSARFLSPVTSQRVHPLALAFEGPMNAGAVGIVAGILQFIYGFTLLELLVLLMSAEKFGVILASNALKHSHFPVSFGIFDHVLLSPHMHQLHHSVADKHWNRNFGTTLSIWDRLFGRMLRPERGETFVYGIGEEDHDYETLQGAFLGPLKKIYLLWRIRPRQVGSWLAPGSAAAIAPEPLNPG